MHAQIAHRQKAAFDDLVKKLFMSLSPATVWRTLRRKPGGTESLADHRPGFALTRSSAFAAFAAARPESGDFRLQAGLASRRRRMQMAADQHSF